MRWIGLIAGLALLLPVDAPAAELVSGLQPGDTAVAFHVEDVTGPRQGDSLCYACAFGKHRVVNIQTTKLTDSVVSLIKEMDALVDNAARIRGDSVHAFVVMLTEDPDIAADHLQEVAEKHQIKNIPLTIYDELTGPPPYKLNTDAEVTIMMWSETKVAANHAFAPGGLDQSARQQVLRDARKHLGK